MDSSLPDTSLAAIGRRLGQVREARGWTKSTIARLLEMSPQRWGQYEGGARLIPPDAIARLWRLTGATSDFILFGRFDGLPYELAEKILPRDSGTTGEKRA